MPSAPDATMSDGGETADLWVIEPRQHSVLERARELWQYRHLWWFFAADTMAAMYRRSKLGWLWLVMRVAGPVGIYAVIFGGVLEVDSGGPPYFLFFLCGFTTWMLFERTLLIVTLSLERNRKLVTKVYFPRLILPMSAVAPGLLYLAMLLLVMIGAVVYYHSRDGVWYITLRPQLLVAAGAVAMSLVFTIAVGLWTSVLQARYRDVRYGLRYGMPFWFYFTPIIYPASQLPESLRWVVAVNPMAGVVEAFKWGTLGAGHLTAVSVTTSLTLIALTMVSGMWYFTREEAASIDTL